MFKHCYEGNTFKNKHGIYDRFFKVYPNVMGKLARSPIKQAKFLFKILNNSCVGVSVTFSLSINVTMCLYQGLGKDSHAYSTRQDYILTQT